MKKQIKDMDIKELGGYIYDALKSKNIHVVLSGGSCVEIYSTKVSAIAALAKFLD